MGQVARPRNMFKPPQYPFSHMRADVKRARGQPQGAQALVRKAGTNIFHLPVEKRGGKKAPV